MGIVADLRFPNLWETVHLRGSGAKEAFLIIREATCLQTLDLQQ